MSTDSALSLSNQIAIPKSEWSDLLCAAREGDAAAFGRLCDHLGDYLLLTVRCRLQGGLRAKFGASDIVQETLLEAQQDLADFQGASENEFRAWLVRLLQHNLIDAARRFHDTQKRDTTRELRLSASELEETVPTAEKTASSVVRRKETDDELLAVLANLAPRRRRLIELRHWQGRSFAEIGEALGISETATRSLWSRTLNELRRKLTRTDVAQSL